MTPSVPATPSAEVGGGFDLDSHLDSVLDAPDTSAEPEQVDDQPIEQEQPAEEAPAEDAVEQPEEVDSDADPEEEFIDEAGRKRYHVKPERMKGFVQAKNFMRAVEEYVPTVEAAKELHANASDFRAMQIEFQSGEPEAVGKFLDFWGSSPEGLNALTTELPAYLAKAGNNQALQALEQRISGALVSRAYSKAAQTGDAGDLYRAQSMDFAHNGKYRFKTVDEIPKRQPQQDAQTELQRREQEINRQHETFVNARWADFDKQALTGAKDTALDSEIEKAFAPVKASYPPAVLSALKREAKAGVEDALKKTFEWSRNHDLEARDIQRDFTRALKANKPTNVEPRATALVNDYKSRAARVLPSIVKPLIADATKSVVERSTATHQKLAAGAQKTAPGGGGKPAPRSIVPVKQGQSVHDRLDDIFR